MHDADDIDTLLVDDPVEDAVALEDQLADVAVFGLGYTPATVRKLLEPIGGEQHVMAASKT
jgi:hypothetical protein